MEDEDSCTSAEINMVTVILLGKCGSTKALVGNTILDCDCFSAETDTCKKVVCNQDVGMCCVINTPDLYYGPKRGSKNEVCNEMKPDFPDARVFLLIIQDDHISSEEMIMLALLKNTYGQQVVDNTIVVLVHNETASKDSVSRSQTGEQVQRILDECGRRVCSFKHGMKSDEIIEQLLAQYRTIQQKGEPERLDETCVDPTNSSDQNSEKDTARSAEEKPVAAMSGGDPVVSNIYECIESFPESCDLKQEEKKTAPQLPARPVAAAPAPAQDNAQPRIPEPSDRSYKHSYLKHEKDQMQSTPAEPTEKPMTIVLLGQTGSGKSATGNTILGKRYFQSYASSTAVTLECEKAEAVVHRTQVNVIDTPDFFNEDLKHPEIQVQKCRELSQPEPVVYLLVMHLGRFTDGERQSVSNIQKAFGEEVVSKTIILFTGKEKLKGKRLDEHINETDPELQQLIKALGSRCHAFDNNDKSRHQVKELMRLIFQMLYKSSGNDKVHYRKRKKSEHKDCRVL